jgi:hypothetical protein
MSIFNIKYFPPETLRITVSSHTANFVAENGKLHLINPAGASLDVQLPAPSASTHIFLKDMSGDLGSKTINIIRNGVESIDGVASNIQMDSEYQTLTLISDGVNWYKV